MSEYIMERPDSPAKVVRDGWNVRIEWDFKQREKIVRCRDCKFSPDDGQTCERDGDEFNVTLVRPDGFCAWGESAWVTCKCGEDIERIGRIQTCPSCGRKVMA